MHARGGSFPAWRCAALGGLMLASAVTADARVARLIIDSSASDGQYLTITGRAFGELDPANPANAIINDLSLGLDADGKARYVTSFRLLRPTDLGKASGLMWHDVPNRGGRVNITADAIAAGDIQFDSAWQGDNASGT